MARIGMVSIWFHRGQSEVTRTLRQALLDNGHEVFIFGRMGAVYGQEMQERDDPYWRLPNVFLFPKYDIAWPALQMWAIIHKLDAVVFNEEYNFQLPQSIRAIGKKTIHYVDFIRPDWAKPLGSTYDQLWSATQRTTALLNDMELSDMTTHIGWGIPDNVPYRGDEAPQYDFFHNAGWLGINFRKGTDLVLQAFSHLVSHEHTKASLLVHAQVPMQAMVDTGVMTQEFYDNVDRSILTWRHETVPPPGLYHLGKVVVQPSRMEGLGLTIPEAMWQGRAVITTDAPPMNEFVRLAQHLVPVASIAQRSDGLSFPECTPDVSHLADRMLWIIEHWKIHGTSARSDAYYKFDWTSFRARIAKGLEALGAK